MKIKNFKTIENAKYISKNIPITKMDIKVSKKEEKKEFDIFESKEYSYKDYKRPDISKIIKEYSEKNNLKELNDEVKEPSTEGIPVISDSNEEISTLNNAQNDDIKETKSMEMLDRSKELDEDIYSDFKLNIEKTIDDEAYLDDPYKAAVKLSREKYQKEKAEVEKLDTINEKDKETSEKVESTENNRGKEIDEKCEDIKNNALNSQKENVNDKFVKDEEEKNISLSKIENNEKDKKEGFFDKIKNIYESIFIHPEQLDEWFDSKKKLAFITALIVGILTHITFITEMIMSQDGLWNSMDYSVPTAWELALGRWGIFLADKVVNYLAIPNITAVVGILLTAISATLIVDLLKLKNKITIFLSAAALAVSPCLAATLLYVYTSVAYCVAMLLSVITVCLIFSKKRKALGFILAIITFTISLGVYQSYIGVTIGLTVIRLIRDLYDKEIKIRWFFIHGIMMVLVVIIGGVLYSHITNKVLENEHTNLASYKGLETISIQNTIDSLPKSIPNIYEDFRNFYLSDEILKNTNYSRQEFYKIMFIATIILELIAIISNKIWKNPFRVLFIAIMTVILPIALNAVELLATETRAYLLTAAQLILIIPFAALICELAGNKGTFIFKWASIISIFLILFTYYLADNTSYMVLKLRYEQAYSTTIRIMDRIEQAEGYSPEKPLMFAGIINDNNRQFLPAHKLSEYTLGAMFTNPVFHGSYSGMEGTWTKYINTFMGLNVQFCNNTSYNDVVNSDAFKEMNIFPEENSVKEIYGVMVVKLSNDPVTP